MLGLVPFLDCSLTPFYWPNLADLQDLCGFSLPLNTSLSASALANFISLWRECYSPYHTVQQHHAYSLVLSDDVP